MFDLKLGVAKNPRTIGTSKEEQVGVKIPEGDIENPADEGTRFSWSFQDYSPDWV